MAGDSSRRRADMTLRRGDRIFAALLATAWIGSGVVAVILGIARRRWLVVVIGPLAIGYGLVWLRVARTGVKMRWPARGD